jgi:hypothetical protein
MAVVALITGEPPAAAPVHEMRKQRNNLQASLDCQSFQIFQVFSGEWKLAEVFEVDDFGVAQNGHDRFGAHAFRFIIELETSELFEPVLVVFQEVDEFTFVEVGHLPRIGERQGDKVWKGGEEKLELVEG